MAQDKLRATFPGIILYPLPDKVVTASPFNSEFLEHRRAGLDLFLRKTCEHLTLRESIDLVAFLQDEHGASRAAPGPGGQRGAAEILHLGSRPHGLVVAADHHRDGGARRGRGQGGLPMEEDPKYLEAASGVPPCCWRRGSGARSDRATTSSAR